MEKELYDWINDQRTSGYIVTLLHIRLQAQKMCKDSIFKASNGWAQKFMRRHGLALRQKTKIAQKLPKDLNEKISLFHTFVISLCKQNNFELSQIGNMDKTPMTLTYQPAEQLTTKESAQSRLEPLVMSLFTAVLSCMVDGTKLKPMVIFKRKLIPKGEKFPPGVVIHCHPKGWMDEEGIILWLKKVWDTRPGALLKKSPCFYGTSSAHI